MDLNDVLRHAVAAGASDVHLKVGHRCSVSTASSPRQPGSGALGDADLKAALDQVTVTAPSHRTLFDEQCRVGRLS